MFPNCNVLSVQRSWPRCMIRALAVLVAGGSVVQADAAFGQATLPDVTAVGREAPAPAEAPSSQASARSAWDAPEPWRTDRFYLETSVYTRHFNYDPAHDDHQRLILGEWNITEQWLVGASLFANSFGQPTQYVYGGYRFRPFDGVQPFYIKVSAGLVHGYTGEYRDKIPFNSAGIAPAVIPSVGYCWNRFCSEVVVFGTAGALLTFGVTVP